MITVEAKVQAPMEKVWILWTTPEHIKMWNNANEQWHTPTAENDLRKKGKFNYRMEAKDGSQGFDFSGTYDDINEPNSISYTIDDGRKVQVNFSPESDFTFIKQSFEPESTHSRELQQQGWQAILNNFKKYAEANTGDQ